MRASSGALQWWLSGLAALAWSQAACEGDAFTRLSPPLISVNADRVDFGTIELGSAAVRRMVITNTGQQNLDVKNVRVLDGPFTVDPKSFVLGPSADNQLDVVFAPQVVGSFASSLLVVSNAENNPAVLVELHGTAVTRCSHAKCDAGLVDVATEEPADAHTDRGVAADGGDTKAIDAYQPRDDGWRDDSMSSGNDETGAVNTGGDTDTTGYADAGNGGADAGTEPCLWRDLATAPGLPREAPVALWIGSQMFICCGTNNSGQGLLLDGMLYDPRGDNWRTIPPAPMTRRRKLASVWTGNEVLIWGGVDSQGNEFNTGARYIPATDRWSTISASGAPSARRQHTGVWTGTQFIVWGGKGGNRRLADGARYSPRTGGWHAMSLANAPTARQLHSAVWTGTEMIIWGGVADDAQYSLSGGRYAPATDSWTATATLGAPRGRHDHTAVWTGAEMIVYGGDVGPGTTSEGGRYNPATDSWTDTSTIGATARSHATGLWTGTGMLVWGGIQVVPSRLESGALYDPQTDNWMDLPQACAPQARVLHAGVWTGTEVIIWSGNVGNSQNTRHGARLRP